MVAIPDTRLAQEIADLRPLLELRDEDVLLFKDVQERLGMINLEQGVDHRRLHLKQHRTLHQEVPAAL